MTSGIIRSARHLQRVLSNSLRSASRRVAAEGGYWLAVGDTGSLVCRDIPGERPASSRACVFVHFDSRGVVRPHTRRYVEAIAAEGFAVTLVSNSSTLTSESLDWLLPRCARILLRSNRGYDFGAYRDGIRVTTTLLEPNPLLLLANDSVYAPIGQLASLLNRMDFSSADVWGATDSWQHSWHLQSYFLAFGPRALREKVFETFWADVRNTRSKWSVIRHYEVGLTRRLLDAQLRCAAVFETHSLLLEAQELLVAPALASSLGTHDDHLRKAAERAVDAAKRRRALNPTMDLWLLLAQGKFPMIKRELLRDDPTNAPDLILWHNIVRQASPDLYREIIDDLKRTVKWATP